MSCSGLGLLLCAFCNVGLLILHWLNHREIKKLTASQIALATLVAWGGTHQGRAEGAPDNQQKD